MPHLLKRSPLTEAVIEFRLAQPLSASDLKKVQKRLLADYPLVETLTDLSVNLNPAAKSAQITSGHAGFRMTSADATSICLLTSQSLATSVLAPYPGWEHFVGIVKKNWSAWRKSAHGRLARVGCRYINRIDIPMDMPVRLEDHFTLYPHLPSADELLAHFVLQVVQGPDARGSITTINMASVPGAILNHASILLDIDIFIQEGVPAKDEGVWELLESFREKKNTRFWEVTTDKTRELFDQ